MPIETPQPPRLSIEALQAVLPVLIGSAGIRHRAPGFAASILAAPRALSSPDLSYPVYTLGLDDIAAGSGLGKARLAAWRHEFTSGDETATAEVSAGRRPRFAGLNVNSTFRSVHDELRSASEGIEGFAERSFDLRLIQISALGIRALWLKVTSTPRSRAHADIVIPVAPTWHGLVARRHYTPAQLVESLKTAAEAVLKADAPGKGT